MAGIKTLLELSVFFSPLWGWANPLPVKHKAFDHFKRWKAGLTHQQLFNTAVITSTYLLYVLSVVLFCFFGGGRGGSTLAWYWVLSASFSLNTIFTVNIVNIVNSNITILSGIFSSSFTFRGRWSQPVPMTHYICGTSVRGGLLFCIHSNLTEKGKQQFH